MWTKGLFGALIFMVGVSAIPSWAQSDIDNGIPDLAGFSVSDLDSSAAPPFGQSGDEFLLQSTSQLTEIEWWGVYFPGNTLPITDGFTVRIFSVDETGPATEPLVSLDNAGVQRVDADVDLGSFDLFAYSLAGLNIQLEPGVYLLSIVNDTAGDPSSDWHWATSSDLDGFARVRATDGSPWVLASNELAFRIRGFSGSREFSLLARSVPEPSNLVFFAGMLTALSGRRFSGTDG